MKEIKSIAALFALAILAGVVFADTSGVSATVNNAGPAIVSVTAKSAEDPTLCTHTAVGAVVFNATDTNGWGDINLTATYVNFTNGADTHASSTCVNTSNGTNWVVISCTGAELDYNDTTGSWEMHVLVVDDDAESAENATETMTYNEGVLMRLVNDPITFGSVDVGSTSNVNTNSPVLKSENCGNVILDLAITGVAITDGGTNSIAVGQFRIDDDVTPDQGGGETDKAELTLTTGSQNFSKVGGQAVSTGTAATWDLYSFLSIPALQADAVYNTGSWTFTPSKTA